MLDSSFTESTFYGSFNLPDMYAYTDTDKMCTGLNGNLHWSLSLSSMNSSTQAIFIGLSVCFGVWQCNHIQNSAVVVPKCFIKHMCFIVLYFHGHAFFSLEIAKKCFFVLYFLKNVLYFCKLFKWVEFLFQVFIYNTKIGEL